MPGYLTSPVGQLVVVPGGELGGEPLRDLLVGQLIIIIIIIIIITW